MGKLCMYDVLTCMDVCVVRLSPWVYVCVFICVCMCVIMCVLLIIACLCVWMYGCVCRIVRV